MVEIAGRNYSQHFLDSLRDRVSIRDESLLFWSDFDHEQKIFVLVEAVGEVLTAAKAPLTGKEVQAVLVSAGRASVKIGSVRNALSELFVKDSQQVVLVLCFVLFL